MVSQQITLLTIDVADVTILVDNSLDILLPSDEVAHRAPMHYDWSAREQLIAEHGYSLLLTVVREGRSESVLYDAGLGRRTVLHNMDVLEVKQPICEPSSFLTDMLIIMADLKVCFSELVDPECRSSYTL